jgi:hypothetical protein
MSYPMEQPQEEAVETNANTTITDRIEKWANKQKPTEWQPGAEQYDCSSMEEALRKDVENYIGPVCEPKQPSYILANQY